MTNEQLLEELKRFADTKIDGVEKRLSRSISRLERKVERFDSNFVQLEEKAERHEANALHRFSLVEEVMHSAPTVGTDLKHRLEGLSTILSDIVLAMIAESRKRPRVKSPHKKG